jgi:2-keto-4-pentenoate hydratase
MRKTIQIAENLISQHKEKKRFTNLTDDLLPISTEEAYLAQFEFQANCSRGALGGFKIGLTSVAQQKLCGIDSPIAGGIFLKEIYPSAHQIRLEDYHGLGIEFELALKISTDIDPSETKFSSFSLLSHIDSIYPAFELIIDRNADYQNLDALSLIADNAWSAGVILGNPIPNWESLQINELNSTLYWNSEPALRAQIKSANPLHSLEWVVNHLGKMGQKIPKDSLIMTGSVLQTRKPLKGDKITYKIEDLSMVEVTIS